MEGELSTMPTYELNSFAMWVAKATEEYFKDPEVQKRFEQWQKENSKMETHDSND